MAVLGTFLVVAGHGWPGRPDRCTLSIPDGCFCERFDPSAVLAGAPGVRQPANTWFNLYALGTSLYVAVRLSRDRSARVDRNLITSANPLADLYVFAVLLLGLGSMWFHASLEEWGGYIDGLSMYMFVGYLICYTAYRLSPSVARFWVGYIALVTAAMITQICWKSDGAAVAVVSVLVAVYFLLEIGSWVASGTVMLGRPKTIALWLTALGSISIAAAFWYLSRTGAALCDPDTLWQPHAVVWHPLAGVTAVLLYHYWREAPG
ncbi:ceramidase domain-containing protein [Microlunatus ginsengisoli]|uniref:ceramidase domain-containing protein n=1 Tax=Microlunatus ginsengisoli TaxID=363863 RepID=UPI0031DB3E9C